MVVAGAGYRVRGPEGGSRGIPAQFGLAVPDEVPGRNFPGRVECWALTEPVREVVERSFPGRVERQALAEPPEQGGLAEEPSLLRRALEVHR